MSARPSRSGMRSVTFTIPVSVWWVVSRTRLSSRYRRVVVARPAGPISQRPCSGVPRSAAKQAGESNRGRQSQSTEPSRPTRAAVAVSPRAAESSIGSAMTARYAPCLRGAGRASGRRVSVVAPTIVDVPEGPPALPSHQHDRLVVRGASEHNLRDVSVDLPRDSLIVFTGLSGSGKSSLAFDTIFAEGQRRYVESLSAYARQFLGQMDKPDVDFIEGLSPAVSIDQKSTNRNPRSTVGT